MKATRRALQVFVLAILGLVAYQPQLPAFSCDDFMQLAWEAAQDDCGGGPMSQECDCSEENGEVTNGTCYTICLDG